ncbi:MAG: AAA domain-containing protein [Planctomycetota bacterium]
MASKRRKKFTSPELEKHFVDMVEWLAMETTAEVERMARRRKFKSPKDAEATGETVLDLVIQDVRPGLGGYQLISFQRRSTNHPMPWHRLKVGTPVVVSADDYNGSKDETGVISKKKKELIEVALNQEPEGRIFRIDMTSDEITRKRQLSAILTAKDSRGRLGQLRDVLMGQRKPRFHENLPDVEFRTNLNRSQQDAVRFALSAEDFAIIHGPPGTGKTTTVVELIVQAVIRGEKVLACAPSNTAVDNLLERLVDLNQKVVRIGHSARVSERLREHSLDGQLDQHENMEIIRDLRREAKDIYRKVDKWSRAKQPKGYRHELRQEARQLQGHARLLEKQAMESILDSAKIICATATFNEDLLGDRWFDLAVIDEACQSVEPGCWVPLLRSDKVIFAGDHQQLPPTVLSTEAARQGFAISLMERQMEQYNDQVSKMLTVQYRMHQQIMNFSSSHFYRGELKADTSVENHLLSDIDGVDSVHWMQEPITFIDTAGAGWDEELEPDGESKRNPNEADLVLRKVEMLLSAGLWAKDIAVIAPYAAQVRMLRDRYSGPDGLEIDTVDGFQGREKEAVVITLVRSNTKGEIGFLADRRRMNVALTRAKRKLIVVGDSATLGHDSFYQEFLDYVEQVGGYHSVWEEETQVE